MTGPAFAGFALRAAVSPNRIVRRFGAEGRPDSNLNGSRTAAPNSRARVSCSFGSAAAILPSASIARARTSPGTLEFITASNAFVPASDSLSPMAKAAIERTSTFMSFCSSLASSGTDSSLPILPAASAARQRTSDLLLVIRSRKSLSQRRSSSALIMRSKTG